jgi:hypothetical protein
LTARFDGNTLYVCRIEIFTLWSCVVEKRELSKTEFELIDEGLKALLDSGRDPVVAEKVADLRSMFKDAYTGWLEVEQEAA